MKVCPRCGYEDQPFWLNHQWQQHIEYCRIEDFKGDYPILASQLTKLGSITSDDNFYYRLTRRGTFVYRWAKKLGSDAYHWDYEAARKKGVAYVPPEQKTLAVICL